ncbi:MAG: hypothetical protein J7605_12930 [Variovorax sp.]|nr:hypothetical protein [Variovorax sp.]
MRAIFLLGAPSSQRPASQCAAGLVLLVEHLAQQRGREMPRFGARVATHVPYKGAAPSDAPRWAKIVKDANIRLD